ncbi:Bdr family repetitive protein (plasmid) [Borreliella yangtzensis]|uniref:Bdr family repetitive protein n=1 Tax=Borreliella yangtzensis TaxID=683292 RepID=UPI003B21D1F6
MSSLAYRTYNIESIKNEFLNIGFSEEAIDFVFLHNDNYNFEYLKEKLIDAEKNLQKDISNLDTKIDTVEKNLNIKIDNVEKNLQKDISMLDTKINNAKNELNAKIDSVSDKIDSVEKSLQKDISNLHSKIDNVEKSLNEKLSMGNRLVHFMIIAAAILGPILNALFMKYLQFIK